MKKHLLKSIFISLILVTGVSNAWAATIFNCGIEVNETWYKGTGTINSGNWLGNLTAFNNKDFGVITSLKLGGQYDTWDDGKTDDCSWNASNGITITIKKGSTQKDQFKLSCYHSGRDGNNNVWKTTGTIGKCGDKNAYGRYTHNISQYAAGNDYTIAAMWFSPSGKSTTGTAKFTIPGFTTTSKSQTFDSTPVGNNNSKTISFGTHYGTTLKTNNCSISGTNYTEFSVTSINESGVTVQFKPTSAGSKTATLTITDAHSKKCTITLSGTAIATYTVTITNDGNGSTVPSGEQLNITEKDGIAINAEAAENFAFTSWTIISGTGTFDTQNSVSTKFYPTSDATIQATFHSTITNSLSVVAGANVESVDGSTDPITLGESYEIKATPAYGYRFNQWTAYPAENATFADAASATTKVTVLNSSVTVTASAIENMSTLTTSNKYDAGDPGYEVPTASVNSIGYETTATVTATTAGNGYTFTGWTLTNCTRTDGGAADATSITVRSNGDGKAATVVANYAEDLATTKWYISGNGNGSGNDLTPGSPFTGWGTGGIQMFKKSGESTKEIYYCTITANTVASSDDHFLFKVYNATTSKYWGNNGYWVTKENNHPTLSSSSGDNMKFRPYLVGTYEFKLDATNASSPVLTVTWPVYNQLRISAANPADPTNTGEFDMTSSDNYTVTRSLQANTKYTFKIVYDSEWYGASSGNFTRASATKTLSTSSNDLTITTDIAGDYTFTFNSSDKKLTVAYPTLPKHQVTVTVNPAESGTITGTGEYEQGSEATLVATPAEGYKFVNWTKGEEVVSTTATYTVSVTEPVVLVANFERVHDVTITYKCNGVEMQSTTQSIGESTPSTITAPNIDNYTFISWEEGDGIAIKEENKEKISIVTKSEGNYVLTANYERVARYLTGNDAGFGMEGEDQWKPNNIKMTWDEASKKYTHTVSGLAAKKYYKFRITDGKWNENKWGYTNLKPTVANTFAAEDNNISFVLSAAGSITVAFDGNNIELTTTSSFAAPVYTIVGDAAITGCHWDVNSVENQMVQDATDKNKFTLVKTVTAAAGEYDYKAIRNYSYDWEVAPDKKLKIEKDGTGTITYTLDVSTKKLTATVSDWVEEVVAQEVTLVGIGENRTFTEADDHKTTSVAVELEANSVYTFEIIVNSVYMKNNGTMWRGNCTNWTFKSEENNAHIVTDLAGTYTFTWTYEGNKLSVTYPNGTNVPAPVFLGGEMNGWSWIDTRLIPSDDGKTASATVNLTEAKTYEFKIKQGDTHFGNNGTMTRQHHENWIFREKDGENDEKNAKITADIVGDYIFTWTYEGSKLTVTYPEVATTPTIIDEGTNTLTDGVTTDVQVNRAFAAGKLYTISLPFALDAEQVEEIFGTGTIIYEFAKVTKEVEVVKLYFQTVSAIAAATPYLIKPKQDVNGFEVEDVTICTTPNNISFTAGATTITMKPILSAATDAKTNGSTEYWLAENTWLYNNVNTIKSLRALFEITTVSGMPPRCRVALGENAETGIDNITTGENPTIKLIENGQLIIIRDGEKFNTIGQKL